MKRNGTGDDDRAASRIEAEIADSFDEELELEIDDERLAKLLDGLAEHPVRATVDRQFYFK